MRRAKIKRVSSALAQIVRHILGMGFFFFIILFICVLKLKIIIVVARSFVCLFLFEEFIQGVSKVSDGWLLRHQTGDLKLESERPKFDDGPFMAYAFAFFQTPTLAAHTMTELFLQKILKMFITSLKIFINTPVTISEDGMTGEIYYT